MKAASQTQCHRYIRKFKDGLVCTLTLSPDAITAHWPRQPNLSHVPEYLAFRDESVAHFAATYGVRILVVTL